MKMIAINTKYLPATDYKGSRIKAYTSNPGQTITISYPYEYDGEKAHRVAAQALMNKMEWPNEIIGGGTKEGYAWVMIPRDQKIVEVN
jgi:hypothetical protein